MQVYILGNRQILDLNFFCTELVKRSERKPVALPDCVPGMYQRYTCMHFLVCFLHLSLYRLKTKAFE
jgi:hypothetical protein